MNVRESTKLSSLPSNMEETKAGYALESQQDQETNKTDSEVMFIGQRKSGEFELDTTP